MNGDKDLKGLGRFVTKTLKNIQFKFRINGYDINESLRCFLEGYINSNGTYGTLKHLEFGHSRDQQVDSFVTYGIQVTISQLVF